MGWNSYRLIKVNGYILGYDQNFYFAWARSIVVDADIDFANDLELVAKNEALGELSEIISAYLQTTPRTPGGYVPNKYGMGMGLVALPSMYLTKAVVRVFNLFPNYGLNDFSLLYAWVFVLNFVFLGFVGLMISYNLLEPIYGHRKSFAAIVMGTAGLSLGYYIWYEPTMSHAASFAIINAYLLISTRWMKLFSNHTGKKSLELLIVTSLFMGFVLGVACTVRYTNVVFAAVPFVFAIKALKNCEKGRDNKMLVSGALCLLAAVAGTFAGFIPQLLSWKTLYGSWFVYSYHGEQMAAWPRYALEILFGLRNSLFLWTPLAIVAVAGLFIGTARREFLAFAGLIVMAGFVWIYGSWECYWLGHSYGMRGLVDGSFFFFLGFAEMITWMESHAPQRRFLVNLLQAGIWFLVVWNMYFIFCYRSLLQPHGEPFAGARLISAPEQPLRQMLADFGLMSLSSSRSTPHTNP
jgi:MFS family permease